MTAHALGSWAWSQATHGQLNLRERLMLVGQLMQSEWRHRRPSASPQIPKAWLDELRPPDSRICQRAEEQAKDTLSEALVGHCHRTYVFGALLARRDGSAFDPEQLFVTALLHDLGIAEHHHGKGCFAVIGAELAHRFLTEEGYDPLKTEQVAEAIALHLNPVIPPRFGSEAVALQAGAFLDVAGMRKKAFDPACLAAIDARYPRRGFRAEILTHIRSAHPRGTRARFLRGFGFEKLVARNPLDPMT